MCPAGLHVSEYSVFRRKVLVRREKLAKVRKFDKHTSTYIQSHTRKPDRGHSWFPHVSMHTRRLATKTATRAPSTPPSTRQSPRTAATAPGSPVVPCFGYTHAHKTQEENRKKALAEIIKEGGVQVGALRCQGCMYQWSTLRRNTLLILSKSIYYLEACTAAVSSIYTRILPSCPSQIPRTI